MSNSLLVQSFEDFRKDFLELEFLTTSQLEKISQKIKLLTSLRSSLMPETYKNVQIDLKHFEETYSNLLGRIRKNQNMTNTVPKESNYEKLLSEKNALYDLIRTQHIVCAAALVSSDWQSPSYEHTTCSQAGSQTGKITGNINDYKRDVHLDAGEYEKQFKKEFTDARVSFSIYTYLTNSGMAAFSTILHYLLIEKKIKGTILVGKNSYFQYRLLLQNAPFLQIIEVDESHVNEICEAIKIHRPSAVFLDTLCNSPMMEEPEIDIIISFLQKNISTTTFLVLDTTCTAFTKQYWTKVWGNNRHLNLITFESLNKYHQYGMDRVTAGVIQVMGLTQGSMYFYREDCGTIISDISSLTLPPPNRKMMTHRLERFQRNATYLAESFLERSRYPGFGSFFTIAFPKSKDKPKHHKMFLDKIISTAKKNKLSIVAGTSFGLNTTRIYHIVPHGKNIKPFVRISVGIEDLTSIHRLKKTLETCLP